MLARYYLLTAGLFLSLSHGDIQAEDDWALCRAPSYQFIGSTDSDFSATDIEAEQVTRDANNLIRFSGQVELNRAGQKIKANEIIIDELSEQLQAKGRVLFEDADYRLQTEAMFLDQKANTATIASAIFELPGQHAQGSAAEISKIDDSRSEFKDILYTSCDPDDRDWHLSASRLTIDDETGRGSAKHATLYFQEIPVLYLPYIMFPIDDRRMSGMLTPLISYSELRGSSLAVPIYWNIAPNSDATFTPAWYSKRGLQWNSENRYLFSDHEGQVDLSYLDDDQTNSRRWRKKWQHKADLDLNITGDLLLQEVSDDAYFSDFEALGSERDDIDYLERHITLSQDSNNWQTRLTWQDHQLLDQSILIADQPYHRLPRLTLDSQFAPFDNGLAFDLRNEWVVFDREASVTGSRLHTTPSIAWARSNSWYYFKPKLQFAISEYSLDNNAPNPDSFSRSIPSFSLDSGIRFERLFSASLGWLQTLEPRLFYLKTPFEDQSLIPDFDTALRSETYENLFKTNRFSGFDRIGDADQFTLGLVSRIFSVDSGEELFNFSLGQTHYREDRRVSLDGTTDVATKSSLIAQFSLRPNANWTIGSKLVRAPDTRKLTERNLSINYSRQRFAANIEYFFTDQLLEQTAVSTVYPLNERWTLVAKSHRSHIFDKPVENLFGLSYESCCWGFKILASQTSDDNFIETDRAIYFELTLKGLSQLGRDIDAELQQSIPGYQAGF